MLCYYGGRLRLHLLAIVVVDRRLDTTATGPDDHLQMTTSVQGASSPTGLPRKVTRADSLEIGTRQKFSFASFLRINARCGIVPLFVKFRA